MALEAEIFHVIIFYQYATFLLVKFSRKGPKKIFYLVISETGPRRIFNFFTTIWLKSDIGPTVALVSFFITIRLPPVGQVGLIWPV